MALMMTTREIAEYLKLHEITVCKYTAQGKIPAISIGRVWSFDKDAVDKWIMERTAPALTAASKEDVKGAKK